MGKKLRSQFVKFVKSVKFVKFESELKSPKCHSRVCGNPVFMRD